VGFRIGNVYVAHDNVQFLPSQHSPKYAASANSGKNEVLNLDRMVQFHFRPATRRVIAVFYE
jgi:hypothetical protein